MDDILNRLHQIENDTLCEFACRSANSKGRVNPESESSMRTVFSRDRDRIIHCKSFRRLKHKTQMFLSPEGDHYRTRLTHTLEVSQIARSLARILMLNEDLTEAISLGHDLGHTPFGHEGERCLNRLCSSGFTHYEQSLRVVDFLEKDGTGLNLTFEVRNGILNHTTLEDPQTLEAVLVYYADRIAYLNHDVDDALRAGIISQKDLPHKVISMLGATTSERINSMIRDIAFESFGKNSIRFSDECASAVAEFAEFSERRLYHDTPAKKEETKVRFIIDGLFEFYMKNPSELPEVSDSASIERSVCDYIAGMTDRFALNEFNRLFIPKSWEHSDRVF